jgi:subtilisin
MGFGRIDGEDSMTKQNQYVVTVPTGFVAASGRYHSALRQLDKSQGLMNVLDEVRENGEKLVEIADEDLARFQAQNPSVVVEPNILYKHAYRHPLLDDFEEIIAPAAGLPWTITVLDEKTRAPVPDATIYLFVDQKRKIGFRGTTGADGKWNAPIRDDMTRIDYIAIMPKTSHWNRKVPNVVRSGNQLEITLKQLPWDTTGGFDWGQVFTGLTDGAADGGNGVKVGIVDSGIRNDHPGLKPSGGLNCVRGEDETRWWDDDGGHGTHCAGIIASILNGARGTKGYAPRAEVRSYRVFGKGTSGASTFDIVKAIDRAITDGCDIISLSLGSPTPQTAIRIRTELAYDRGIVCIAATGNEGTSVSFPAAFPSVVAVSAIGKFGSYPEDSLHKETESRTISADGEYFVANFSNYGPEVALCAPGVAIASTVPGGGYGAWDGTSMACPQVSGIAALALVLKPEILKAARDAARAEALIKLLRSKARSLKFGSKYEGSGCPSVASLLAS